MSKTNQIEEDVNCVGGGAIAGVGVGPQGEPGVSVGTQPKNKKANYRAIIELMKMVKRKPLNVGEI